MIRHLRNVALWKIAVCLVGLVACAVPCDLIDRGFEGASRSGSPVEPGVRISSIQPGSQADVAGLQDNDLLLAINGQRIWYASLDSSWKAVPVGSEVDLEVIRGVERPHPLEDPEVARQKRELYGKRITLHTVRRPDVVVARVYWGWQLMAGLTFLVLCALVIATQRLHWLDPWRGAILITVATGMLVPLFVVDWTFQWELIWKKHPLGRGTDLVFLSWQRIVVTAACVALVLLGAVDLRRVLERWNRPRYIPS